MEYSDRQIIVTGGTGALGSAVVAALVEVEALNRHRGKGQQKVTVEHVHVHQGGQAIVGHVQHNGGGQQGNGGSTPCKGD